MDNKILKNDYIFLDVDLKNQQEAFAFIAEKASAMKIVSSKSALVSGFKKREQEGSTGFEDGFAIPHARIKEVKQAAVFVLRFKKAIDWASMDGKPTKVAIALLIPEGPSGDEHLAMLADIAVKLMDADFKQILTTTKAVSKVVAAMAATKSTTPKPVEKNKNGLNILAITSCTVGVAHTYMAEDKLLTEVPKTGNNIRVETHGSKGVGTPFTKAEIEAADLIIFVVDANVDKSRFAGKKFYQSKVTKAIKDPQGLVAEAIEKGVKLTGLANAFDTKAKEEKTGVLTHILAGVSYMIPIIVLGGICLAVSIGLAKAIGGPDAGTGDESVGGPWGILHILDFIGGAAFTLMIPILAGFIGNSIAGRAAIAPAMVGAFIGNTPANIWNLNGLIPKDSMVPLGFIGAILAGLAVGYLVKYINTWKVPRSLQAAMPIFFIPLVAGISISIIFIYVIGAPIAWVMFQIQNGIKEAYRGEIGVGVGIGLGFVLGAMAGFDMGGPINKIAFLTSSALVTLKIYEPMGSIAAGIPVAPLAMGLSTVIARKFFNKNEQGMGIAAMIMGCIGISEGAIPFALRDPKRAIVANVAGSGVAAAIAGGLGVQDYAAHGGPIVAVLGAVPYGLQTLYYFMAVAIGVVVTTSIYVAWLKYDAGAFGSVKEVHVAHLMHLANIKRDDKATINEQKLTINNNKKAEIKAAKLAGKDVASIELKFANELADLKTKKEQLLAKYKNDVAKAKEAYKTINSQEKEFIKTQKEQIKAYVTKVNEATKTNVGKVNAQITNAKNETNKLKQREIMIGLKTEKHEFKEAGLAQKNEHSAELRKEYVTKYNQAIA